MSPRAGTAGMVTMSGPSVKCCSGQEGGVLGQSWPEQSSATPSLGWGPGKNRRHLTAEERVGSLSAGVLGLHLFSCR